MVKFMSNFEITRKISTIMAQNELILKIIQNHNLHFKQVSSDFLKYFEKISFFGVEFNENNPVDIINELNCPIPFNDGKFDCVILRNPFNMIENYRELFVELNRIMKKNALLVCIFDKENVILKPKVWQEKYLKKLFSTTGFNEINISLAEKFQLWLFKNKTQNIVLFGSKISNVKETYSKKCQKCSKPLGKKWRIDKDTNKAIHENCPS